jgi:hypothetical protein
MGVTQELTVKEFEVTYPEVVAKIRDEASAEGFTKGVESVQRDQAKPATVDEIEAAFPKNPAEVVACIKNKLTPAQVRERVAEINAARVTELEAIVATSAARIAELEKLPGRGGVAVPLGGVPVGTNAQGYEALVDSLVKGGLTKPAAHAKAQVDNPAAYKLWLKSLKTPAKQ